MDVSRPEIRSFLLSAALYWLDCYHVDGLRLDGRIARRADEGQDREVSAAFVRDLCSAIHDDHPDVLTILGDDSLSADVSAEFALPLAPGAEDGPFDLEWNRDWTRCVLAEFSEAPEHRGQDRDGLTCLARLANRPSAGKGWILPFSHTEVVAGRGSLLERMPGDAWRQRANLRLLLGCLYASPGKKLLFMGGEFGQLREWRPDVALDWSLLERAEHRGLATWVRDLNHFYRRTPALFQREHDSESWTRVDVDTRPNQVLALLRQGDASTDLLLAVCNVGPEPIRDCRIGSAQGRLVAGGVEQ